MLPDFDEATTRMAGALTALGGVLAGLWKIRGWLKADSRAEGAAERTDDGWRRIVDGLEAHIHRLEARVKAAEDKADFLTLQMNTMQTRIRDEIDRRYLVEQSNHALENANAGLRAALAELRGTA